GTGNREAKSIRHDRPDRRRSAHANRGGTRSKDPARHQARHLRRARRGSGFSQTLPSHWSQLRELLAVPRACRAPGCGPGGHRGKEGCEADLSTPFHKYDHVCCVDFRFWPGATREHPPKWGCDRGATKPEPKSDATLRAAVLFGPDVVAHSVQTAEGYARRSGLVRAKNPSPQTWLYLWNGVLRRAQIPGSSLSTRR